MSEASYLRVSVGSEALLKHSGSGSADPGTGVAALQHTTLVLGLTAPDTVVLVGRESPREALLKHVTTAAHLLGFFDLEDRAAGVADGEEQFRILIEANGFVTPIHGGISLHVGAE